MAQHTLVNMKPNKQNFKHPFFPSDLFHLVESGIDFFNLDEAGLDCLTLISTWPIKYLLITWLYFIQIWCLVNICIKCKDNKRWQLKVTHVQGLNHIDSDQTGLNQLDSDQTSLNQLESDQTGLNQFELDQTSLNRLNMHEWYKSQTYLHRIITCYGIKPINYRTQLKNYDSDTPCEHLMEQTWSKKYFLHI